MNIPTFRRFVKCQDDGTPQLFDDENINASFQNISLSFSTEQSEGSGNLFITSRRIIWIGNDSKAYDFDVPYITLHAITHDINSFPQPCLYCQLDSSSEENEYDEENFNECFFVPGDEERLTILFDAFSEAALNNPDQPEDDESDDDFIFNEEEVTLGAQQARILDHLESVFVVPSNIEVPASLIEQVNGNGQFDDASEDMEN